MVINVKMYRFVRLYDCVVGIHMHFKVMRSGISLQHVLKKHARIQRGRQGVWTDKITRLKGFLAILVRIL